jgi:guanyl-specific ribonuclease Sa
MTEINQVAERVAARRAELDEEEKLLAERLDAVRAEREELVVAMRVWERMHAQLDAERPSAQAATVQVGGRGVLLVPHREAGAGEEVLPPDYQRLMKIVRNAGGPIRVKDVGVELGLEVEAKGRLEPLRGKLSKLAGRGWLRKLPDGRFQIAP